MLRAFQELWLLVHGLMKALGVLTWVVVLLGVILYVGVCNCRNGCGCAPFCEYPRVAALSGVWISLFCWKAESGSGSYKPGLMCSALRPRLDLVQGRERSSPALSAQHPQSPTTRTAPDRSLCLRHSGCLRSPDAFGGSTFSNPLPTSRLDTERSAHPDDYRLARSS